ncbi:helix-turn-helix domain-containing protein [Clostridium grantii]|uniref:Helix-turn-helix domain-containing protein n=1 Tax=Clostridium grantii DSM 8605 TaxID=1121316 RepID=A0A1M5UW82_9CLOT|nr:helix-turn-helix transcriptional regulator [Clostridium grantii]SHH67287.1 Helix-turn-helix domain-containing protein [Clostridium grantii DSM 8605]
MEVITVGEKIKRARIYKGFTLKNLCGKDISVSKLSCIENGKVKPEKWILKALSEKLGVDYEELKKEIDQQIVESIKQIESDKHKNEEDYIEHLYEYAKLANESKYYELAFSLTHKIFLFMIEKKNFKKVLNLLGLHYELSNKTKPENKLTYYFDAATYFFQSEEYLQAKHYYYSIKEELLKVDPDNKELISKAAYYEILCFHGMKEYKKAYELAKQLEEYFYETNFNNSKSNLYHIMAILAIINNDDNYSIYMDKAYTYYEDNNIKKVQAKLDFGLEFLKNEEIEKGKILIEEALKEFDKRDKEEYAVFLLKAIEALYNQGIYNMVDEYIDAALDLSIILNKAKLMEKAYYYKTKQLITQENFFSAEMYLTLSLEFLLKFGKPKELYQRYMEMGKFYYDIKNVEDAVKCFTSARSMKNRL